ncbi:MAM and LDL-receptor class A domain-containing protein 2 [Trichoplax sp. H2]|nr:MAM and LDL-receptor class A domain-containing protein 2 [Trichoplax sp. H2]|eukprot:RDD37228.1 MAM and LDL-receptor class A domain-containing protein 2 [Trichoplax sp. H2]
MIDFRQDMIMMLLLSFLLLTSSINGNQDGDTNLHPIRRFKRSGFNVTSVYNFTVPPVYYSHCSFDNGTCGWNQLQNIDFFDWTRLNTRTPSSTTGPNHDHTQGNSSGYYMYIEATQNKHGQYADLISPPLLLSAFGSSVQVSFYYYAYGNNLAELSIYVMYPRYESAPILIKNMTLVSRQAWILAVIPFKPKYSTYRILFRGVIGSTYSSDIAIDDVSVTPIERSCYTGNGEFYHGTIRTAVGGLSCEPWSLFNTTFNNQTGNNFVKNYCRNPIGMVRNRPWCYTNSTTGQWKYCNVEKCIRLPISGSTYPLGNRVPMAFVANARVIPYSGRVVVYHDGQWGTICNEGLTDLKVELMCQSFGFANSGISTYSGRKSSGLVWINASNINCDPSMSTIQNCDFNPWGSSCSTDLDTWLICRSKTVSPSTIPRKSYDLSLINRKNTTTGIIYASTSENGYRHGVICPRSRDINDADVACRQMGYLGAYSYYINVDSTATQSTLINSINCKGYENSIEYCQVTEPTTSNTCNYNDMFAVSCRPAQKSYTTSNKPSNCEFLHGQCGWKANGNPTWIWYGSYRKYTQLDKYEFYIQFIKPAGYTKPIKAVLTSPYFQRKQYAVYVSYYYYLTSNDFEKITTRYGYKGSVYTYSVYTFYVPRRSLYRWYYSRSSYFYPSRDSSFKIEIVCQSKSTPGSSSVGAIGLDNLYVYGVDDESGSGLSSSTVARIVIGCSVGFGALIVYAIFSYAAKRRRNRAARNVSRSATSRSRRNNLSSSGITRLTSDDSSSAHDPMNFSSPVPPPSYPSVVSDQNTGDPNTSQTSASGIATASGNSQNNDSNYPMNSSAQTQYANPAAKLPPPPSYDDSSFI